MIEVSNILQEVNAFYIKHGYIQIENLNTPYAKEISYIKENEEKFFSATYLNKEYFEIYDIQNVINKSNIYAVSNFQNFEKLYLFFGRMKKEDFDNAVASVLPSQTSLIVLDLENKTMQTNIENPESQPFLRLLDELLENVESKPLIKEEYAFSHAISYDMLYTDLMFYLEKNEYKNGNYFNIGYASLKDDAFYFKIDKNMLYAVYIINNDEYTDDEFLLKMKDINEIVDNIRIAYKLFSAIIKVVIVEKNTSFYVKKYIKNALPYYEGSTCLIPIGISLENNTAFYNEEQPLNSMHILDTIQSILTDRFESQPGYKLSGQKVFENKFASKTAFFTVTTITVNILIHVFFRFMLTSNHALFPFQKIVAAFFNTTPNAMFEFFFNGFLVHHDHFSLQLVKELITSMFLHANFTHIAANMLGIYIFGYRLEKTIGTLKTTIIYFLSSFVGGILQMYFLTNGGAIGSSGGVYGLVGMALAYTIVFKEQIYGLSFGTLITYGILGIALGFVVPNTGNLAHIGGFFTGLILGCVFFLSKKRKYIFQVENR